MTNDMFQADLTDEEMQQVTGGVGTPWYLGTGFSGVAFTDQTGQHLTALGSGASGGNLGAATGFNSLSQSGFQPPNSTNPYGLFTNQYVGTNPTPGFGNW